MKSQEDQDICCCPCLASVKQKPESCWCSQHRMKSVASGWGWLIHGQSSLSFTGDSICFPETNKPKGCYLSAWQRGSLLVVMTSTVLSAARRLSSTCRTGILPRWSRHQMSHELCMCSFWKRRLTSCFLKSCGLTRLVCFGSLLLVLRLGRIWLTLHLETEREGFVSATWCLGLHVAFQQMVLKTIPKVLIHLW